MKQIYLVFTRDFDQWVNEMVRKVLVEELPRVLGKGLSDNITYYTGRTFEWYRYVADMESFKKFIIHKRLNYSVFSSKTQKQYLENVSFLRALISKIPSNTSEGVNLLQTLKHVYTKLYPFYFLSVFLPGVWRQDFLKFHGHKGNRVIERFFKSRESSEGLLKEITNFMREWLRPKIRKLGYDPVYSKLLTMSEIGKFVKYSVLPAKKDLAKRAKGFLCINNRIFPTTDFLKFIKQKRLSIKSDKNDFNGMLFGTTAYQSKSVRGKVKIVLNADEVRQFQKGMVLVTSMTAPEYLPIMKSAVAIVTDEGGLTCHAAIVARELKKPCIIGTKIATKVFKNGMTVEVDANRGIVRIIK